MNVQTANFGAIDVPEDKIISFREGIPGFPQIHRFAIVEFENLKPFLYLQSLGEPAVALLIVNPFLFLPSYQFEVGKAEAEELRTEDPADVSVFAVATIPENPSEATINLIAPILINEKNRCGKQIILLDSQYSVRQAIFAPGSAVTGTGSE
jgi:flagellar assembly factor FliW